MKRIVLNMALVLALIVPLYASTITYQFESIPGQLGNFPFQRAIVHDASNYALDPIDQIAFEPGGFIGPFPLIVPPGAVIQSAHLSVGAYSPFVVLPGTIDFTRAELSQTGLPCVAPECSPARASFSVAELVQLRLVSNVPLLDNGVVVPPSGADYDLVALGRLNGGSPLGLSADWSWHNHIKLLDPGRNATTEFVYSAFNPEIVDIDLTIGYSVPEPSGIALMTSDLLGLLCLTRKWLRPRE